MTTVYQTDADGFFVRETLADPDPVNEGEWLVPGGCVLDAPPAIGARQAAHWTGEAWELVPDLRGTAYWTTDGTRHTVTERGMALPPGALSTPPSIVPPAPTVVTPVQAFTALDQAGKLAPLLSYLDAHDTPPLVRAVALGATEWRRDSLMLMTVAIVLGLSPEQVDALFVTASGVNL